MALSYGDKRILCNRKKKKNSGNRLPIYKEKRPIPLKLKGKRKIEHFEQLSSKKKKKAGEGGRLPYIHLKQKKKKAVSPGGSKKGGEGSTSESFL